MCGIILSHWLGRHNNPPIVQGSTVNARVVKPQPVAPPKYTEAKLRTSAEIMREVGRRNEKLGIPKLKEDQKIVFLGGDFS